MDLDELADVLRRTFHRLQLEAAGLQISAPVPFSLLHEPERARWRAEAEAVCEVVREHGAEAILHAR